VPPTDTEKTTCSRNHIASCHENSPPSECSLCSLVCRSVLVACIAHARRRNLSGSFSSPSDADETTCSRNQIASRHEISPQSECSLCPFVLDPFCWRRELQRSARAYI
jgi:hypothetical protein